MNSGNNYFVSCAANFEFMIYWGFCCLSLFQVLVNSVKIAFRLTLFAVLLELILFWRTRKNLLIFPWSTHFHLGSWAIFSCWETRKHSVSQKSSKEGNLLSFLKQISKSINYIHRVDLSWLDKISGDICSAVSLLLAADATQGDSTWYPRPHVKHFCRSCWCLWTT